MNMLRYSLLSFLLLPLLFACAREPESAHERKASSPARTAPPGTNLPVILAFGDSLTAGHGVELVDSYPSQLQKELERLGYHYRVVNAGISGDTTSGGLSRIDDALSGKPKIVILELGANDGLRGLPLEETKRNLAEMITRCQKAGATVILTGMTLPLNYGPDYIRDFEKVFPDLAKQYKTVLMPFFLEDVAARANLNQEDGIHPTGPGYTIIVRNLLRYLEPLLTK